MPSTVDAVLLLGWMERDAAIKCLREDCVFDHPLTDQEAEGLWQTYRSRAEALPERTAAAPQHLPLSSAEQHHANKLLSFLQQMGVQDVRGVLKINLTQLVARQYFVVTERSEAYSVRCSDPSAWMEEFLPTALTNPPVNVTGSQNNLDTAFDIDIPHGEFTFGLTPNGMFAPIQFLRHVSVMNVGERMLLWKGYHRSYARVLSAAPPAADQSALVALTATTLFPPPAQPGGATVAGGAAGLDLFGCRPPLFSDFFTDGLFMKAKLRKKRYQLQVRSKWVQIDDNL